MKARIKPGLPALVMALPLTLADCAAIAPDTHPLQKRELASAELSAGIKLAQEGWPEAQWWIAYHDEQLNAIIRQALAASIAQSYFRLQGAWARLANAEQLAATHATLVQDKARRIAHGLANADQQRAAEADLSQIRKQQA